MDAERRLPLPAACGGVPDDDCHRAFNMGIGMIVGCAPDDAGRVMAMLQAAGEARAVVIGKIVAGNPGVLYGKLT